MKNVMELYKIYSPVDIEMTGAPRSIVFKSPLLPTEMGQPPGTG